MAFRVTLDDWAFRILAWVFSFAGLVLSCLSAESCRFVRVTTLRNNVVGVNLVGLFSTYSVNIGQCFSLRLQLDAQDPTAPGREIITGSHRAAMAFGVLACLAGAAAMFLLLVPVFKRTSRGLWTLAGGLCGTALVFQGLTFLIFNDDRCKKQEVCQVGAGCSVLCAVDKGGEFAITAMVMYLFAGLLVRRTPAPTDDPLFVIDSADDDGRGERKGGPKTT
eukprot:CAMPEP_0183321974 /NCGR_PEP_ID=MMETSP0160_2-20130417/70341_1 /TAXON_ID=2839 ORGANISM="Odontella Sinensis, Strain Grunow 1884" /NCGR_SAMPLE_ID=MMETSP0160_2 /ASSEMBLY_ACC=CAM_ASM_000250 /LENGTH=220 /DNA_ID=CAMNT_0025489025 /DNA_START=84 /DNA_END=743 /DNA_ORIENTATION=-